MADNVDRTPGVWTLRIDDAIALHVVQVAEPWFEKRDYLLREMLGEQLQAAASGAHHAQRPLRATIEFLPAVKKA